MYSNKVSFITILFNDDAELIAEACECIQLHQSCAYSKENETCQGRSRHTPFRVWVEHVNTASSRVAQP